MGEELFALLKPLGEWAIQWAKAVSNDTAIDWDEYGEISLSTSFCFWISV
jgi:hypothetical protein